MKKISIIVPIYNCEKYLNRCIESVLSQTYKNFELILINDGSKDNSLKICKNYKKKDDRIVLIDKENEGVSQTRNKGIEVSTGEYIMFIDADDWIDINTVEECINNIGYNDMLLFPYIREYKNKSIRRNLYENHFEEQKINTLEENDLYLEYIGPYNTNISNPVNLEIKNSVWGKIYKKELIKGIKFVDFKEIIGEDLLFNIMYTKKIKSYKYIDNINYHYNKVNEKSLTKVDTYKLFYRWNNLYQKIKNETKAESKELQEEINNRLDNRIIINLLTILQQINNSKENIKIKKENINVILNEKKYLKSFKNFDENNLDFKWKLFYKCCRNKKITMLMVLLKLIDILRKLV